MKNYYKQKINDLIDGKIIDFDQKEMLSLILK